MKRLSLTLFCLLLPAAASAQLAPVPSFDDPRMQTIVYQPNMPVRLVVFPRASLKLMFHPGEHITRVVVSDGAAFTAAVLERSDAIELAPMRNGASATMKVETDQRSYTFELQTGEGLAAAYLVRFVPGETVAVSAAAPAPDAPLISYRLQGDRTVRPDRLYDDGTRTFIEWSRNRALPAVFGIGPGGSEEVVAGYMRDDVFVIDRIYNELVFRFDKERATARRESKPS